METKGRIRQKTLALRDGLSEEERGQKSRVIMHKLKESACYREAKLLLVYRNYKSEVETKELIEEALTEGKRVYCPRVDAEEMEFYRIRSLEELTQGYKGIPEPAAQEEKRLKKEDISVYFCLAVLPGSAFDKERNRIGYGKGYYDRYLNRFPSVHTAAVCFDCQLVEEIPAESHDRKPEFLITESTFIKDPAKQ